MRGPLVAFVTGPTWALRTPLIASESWPRNAVASGASLQSADSGLGAMRGTRHVAPAYLAFHNGYLFDISGRAARMLPIDGASGVIIEGVNSFLARSGGLEDWILPGSEVVEVVCDCCLGRDRPL
jgi:hypothetical protein